MTEFHYEMEKRSYIYKKHLYLYLYLYWSYIYKKNLNKTVNKTSNMTLIKYILFHNIVFSKVFLTTA